MPPERVVTTWSAEELLDWTREGRLPARVAGSERGTRAGS